MRVDNISQLFIDFVLPVYEIVLPTTLGHHSEDGIVTYSPCPNLDVYVSSSKQGCECIILKKLYS